MIFVYQQVVDKLNEVIKVLSVNFKKITSLSENLTVFSINRCTNVLSLNYVSLTTA